MGATEKDRYDEMTGPVLAEELGRRELSVTGKVDELRDRLREDDTKRAEKAAEASGSAPEGEETETDDVEVPEPREPVEYSAGMLILNEQQARALTAGEARLRHFTKHVTRSSERKYCEGDRVTGVFDYPNGLFMVLPFGIEVVLPEEEDHSDGLEKLRQADAQLSGNEG